LQRLTVIASAYTRSAHPLDQPLQEPKSCNADFRRESTLWQRSKRPIQIHHERALGLATTARQSITDKRGSPRQFAGAAAFPLAYDGAAAGSAPRNELEVMRERIAQ